MKFRVERFIINMSTISQEVIASNKRARSVYSSCHAWVSKREANDKLDTSIGELDLFKASPLAFIILRKLINYQKTRTTKDVIMVDLSRARWDTNNTLSTLFKVSERNIKYAMTYLRKKDLIVSMTVQGSRKRDFALSCRLISYLLGKDFIPFTVLSEDRVTGLSGDRVTGLSGDRVTVLSGAHRVRDLEKGPSKAERGPHKLSLSPDFLKSLNPVLGYHPDISIKNKLIRDLVNQHGIEKVEELRDSAILEKDLRFTWGEDFNPRDTDLPIEEINDYIKFITK